jgi:hypothetical protein
MKVIADGNDFQATFCPQVLILQLGVSEFA